MSTAPYDYEWRTVGTYRRLGQLVALQQKFSAHPDSIEGAKKKGRLVYPIDEHREVLISSLLTE